MALMTAVRFTGMASGLPPNIVDQLMDAERLPIKTIETQKAKQEDKLKLVTELETKVNEITKSLGELAGINGFMDKKLISGDPNIIDGTLDPNTAKAGEYMVEVNQLAQRPGAITAGFPDRDKTELGVGYFKFKTTEGTKEVYISGPNTTLDNVARQINESQTGIRAEVVVDRKDKDNPYRMIISGISTGDNKDVNFPQVYLLDGDADVYFDETRPARNAKVKIDGFELEITDNILKDCIPGVTLDLKQTSPGREVKLTVKDDAQVISGKVKSFVDAYNGALSFIQTQNKLQKSGRNPSLGPLGGDGLLRSVEASLRQTILDPEYNVGSSIDRLSTLGIEFNRNGTLEFKQERFNAVVASNPNGVAAFMRGDGISTGFVARLKRQVNDLVNANFGPIANRKKGMQDKIEQMNRRIETKERQLEKKEEGLRKKFADLESKMSGLKTQGAAFGAMQMSAAGNSGGG